MPVQIQLMTKRIPPFGIQYERRLRIISGFCCQFFLKLVKKYLKAAGSLTALREADMAKMAEFGIPQKDAAAILAFFKEKKK